MKECQSRHPIDKQGGEQALFIDLMTPLALVDVQGFSRRAGEILARAARTLLSLSRAKSGRKVVRLSMAALAAAATENSSAAMPPIPRRRAKNPAGPPGGVFRSTGKSKAKVKRAVKKAGRLAI
jgi:hypothetical protein